MPGPRLLPLLDAWKTAFGEYSSHKSEAEGAVARWEWASRERYSPLPFHFERFPGRGRALKNGPPDEGSSVLYGFDAQGRARVYREYPYRAKRPASLLERLFTPDPGPDVPYSETFYRYAGDQIESIAYSVDPHIPLRVERIDLAAGRVVFHATFRLNGYTPLYGQKGKDDPGALYEWLGPNGRFWLAEAYLYEGGRLSAIESDYESPGAGAYTARESFTYGEDGRLQRIDRVYAGGQKQLVYRRRARGQTFQALAGEVGRALVEGIRRRIAGARVAGKVYGVMLNYLSASQQFPPAIVVLPEAYRQAAARSPDPDERGSVYCPVFERDWLLQIEDPALLEACQALEQEVQAGQRWNAATRVLREVAADLTRQDWSGILDVTPDFVVFALDPEMESGRLVEALSGSAPPEQIRAWIEQGWLTPD